MARWVVVGGGSAGCVVAANLATGRPDDSVVLVEAEGELGGASLVNGGLVVGDPSPYRHRLPLEPAPVGPLGAALLSAEPTAAVGLVARRHGARVSVAEAYLAERPPNLTVSSGVPVVRLAIDGDRAEGVVTAHGDVAADRVVLSAGAVGSPVLLLRSGVTAPGVGEGLQDHLGVAIVARPEGPVTRHEIEVAVTAEFGDRQLAAVEPNSAMDGYGALVGGWLAVRSAGAVRLPDPDGPPVVDAGRLTDPADMAGAVTMAAALRRVVAHPDVLAVADRWYADDAGTPFDALAGADEAAIAAWAASVPNPYHHLAGSCRMGRTVDGGGWVRGFRNLAVCDASVLPGVPRRNPYLAVVDLAERISSAWAAAAEPGGG